MELKEKKKRKQKGEAPALTSVIVFLWVFLMWIFLMQILSSENGLCMSVLIAGCISELQLKGAE